MSATTGRGRRPAPAVDPGTIEAPRYSNDEATNGPGNCPMNEIRPVTGVDPPSVEVEPVDPNPPDLTTPGDPASHEPDTAGPGSAFEPRLEDRRVAQRYRTREGRC